MTERGGSDITPTGPSTALEHGGGLERARRMFPHAPEPFVDLSTGINPVGYPVGECLPETWKQLPEQGALSALERVAAIAYGAAAHEIVAAPGTQILIGLLPHLLGVTDVRVWTPTYGEHLAAWRNAGVPASEVSSLHALRGAGCAVLCNPNNPDGRRVGAETLLALAVSCGLLIVDEAFGDFEPGLSLAPHVSQGSIVVLRSFGKTYGLAGLRLGFAITEAALADRLRRALGPWAVSGPALAIGTKALADRGWRQAARDRCARDAARLDTLLAASGLQVVGGTTLFRLAESSRAESLFDRLGSAGLLVRRFERHPNWLRFGLPGDEPAWTRLAAALSP